MPNLRIYGSTTNVAEVSPGWADGVTTEEKLGISSRDISARGLQIRPSAYGATGAAIQATGGLRLLTENDTGAWTGEIWTAPPECSTGSKRLRVGLDTLLFYDNFNSTVQNSTVWKHAFTTMTLTAGGGYLLFNTNLSSTAAVGAGLSTWRTFSLNPAAALIVEGTFDITTVPQANQIFEFGLFLLPSGGNTAPVDGMFFRLASDGLCGVLNYSGATITTGDVVGYDPVSNLVMGSHTWYFEIDAREVQFWLDDVLVGTMATPPSTGAPFLQASLPITMLMRNTGIILGAPLMQVKAANVCAYLGDMSTSKPWAHQLAGLGLMCSQQWINVTPTLSNCSTALYTNSLAAGTGFVLTNTTAAAGNGLGGQFSAQPTLVAPNDGLLCTYLNPVGTVNVPGRVLHVTGVRVQGVVTTALTGGPVLYAYSIAYGQDAVTLARANTASFATATTKAARRIPLGFETYPATSSVGVTGGPGIGIDFQVPIQVNPGEYFGIAAKNLATATSAGVITVLVTVTGYFE